MTTANRRLVMIIGALLLLVTASVLYWRASTSTGTSEPKRQIVASLHEIGALPKDYDGWLAHVEAELLAEGEEPPPDPMFPQDDLLRCPPVIVDISVQGDVSLNASTMKPEQLVDILKRVYDGQTEPDPIYFRIAMDARIAAVEPVAQAIVAAGFGDILRPMLFGDEFARVYSIKLGGRFLRVIVETKEPLAPR